MLEHDMMKSNKTKPLSFFRAERHAVVGANLGRESGFLLRGNGTR